MSTLQQRLEAALVHAKMTRQDLINAKIASRQAVNKWFDTDAKNLKMEHLFEVADACRVDARWLATGKGSMTGGKPTVSDPLAEIPQRRIDLIRMYGRLPDEVRQPIRALIESLAWMNHPRKGEYVKRQKAKTPMAVHDE